MVFPEEVGESYESHTRAPPGATALNASPMRALATVCFSAAPVAPPGPTSGTPLPVILDSWCRTISPRPEGARMHLIQILLPVYDNDGKSFPASRYADVRRELTERFGGLTA